MFLQSFGWYQIPWVYIFFSKRSAKRANFLSISESADSLIRSTVLWQPSIGICRVDLVHRRRMIPPGLAFSGSFIFQSGQAGYNPPLAVDVSLVKITGKDNLSLRDIAGQIGIGWVLSPSGIVKIGI